MTHFKYSALAMVLCAGAFQSAAAEETPDQENGYKDFANFVTSPVGFWTQENKDFEEGGDAAKYWLGTFREGPGGQSVLSDAYAVSNDNSCQLISHFVYYFDAENGAMKIAATLGNGAHKNSKIMFTDDGAYVLEVTINTPGGEIIMKDTTTFPDANTRKAQAEFFNSETGDWDMRDAAYWQRAGADFQNPCR